MSSTGSELALSQPTPFGAILKVTGDWQKFKGEPGAEGNPQGSVSPKVDKLTLFAAAVEDGEKKAKNEPALSRRRSSAAEAAPVAEEAPEAPVAEDAAPADGPGGRSTRSNRKARQPLRGRHARRCEHLVRGIVAHPDDVDVSTRRGRQPMEQPSTFAFTRMTWGA